MIVLNKLFIFNRNINLYLISNKKTFKNLILSIRKKIIFKDIKKIKLNKI